MHTGPAQAAAWAARNRELDGPAAADAAWAKKQQAKQALIRRQFTLAVTQQRRAEWNAWVTKGRRPNPAQLATRQRMQGWTMADLARAIERHGL